MPAILLVMLLLTFSYTNSIQPKKLETTTVYTCLNETECDELGESNSYTESTLVDNTSVTEESTTIGITSAVSTNVNLRTTTVRPKVQTTTSPPEIIPHIPDIRNVSLHKIKTEVCECDLTSSFCDINCCCDNDCKEYQLTVFSHCEDHPAELYDSRYCYSRNFIEHNNTQFILEKLADNLFCIVYDNLPPTYSVADSLVIRSHKDLKNAINPSKLTWNWEIPLTSSKINNSYYYQDDDIVWKLQNNSVKQLEFLQTGFTELCAFKKRLKYLRNWQGTCMQTELANKNIHLFATAYNNFTIIASPNLFNETYIASMDQMCPRNVCLPIISNYCFDSWNNCNNTKLLPASCLNGVCHNIVKGVRYLIVHNGTMGIKSVNAYFNIGNVSNSFHQQFEVWYKWVDLDKAKTFTRSGNPGYMLGKPIIIGTLVLNKTDNVESKYILHNVTDGFLTLPIRQNNKECSKTDRYVVEFGTDVKLKCSVSLQTINFTTQSCMKLQNQTLNFWLKNSLFNVTRNEQYKLYVSKFGNFTDNSTSTWLQIVLNKIPQNVITGYISNGELRCSGLVTSVHYQILYSVLSKPQSLTNHQILGIGITFSDEVDLSWSVCTSKNCSNFVTVDIASYVTFHDVSKPSKYYFVGGPNLDISLPYDFFYPFLSNSVVIKPSLLLTCTAILTVVVKNIFYSYI